MSLVEQREQWGQDFLNGIPVDSKVLSDYRKNRENNYWRVSRQVEILCEYILYLESRLEENE